MDDELIFLVSGDDVHVCSSLEEAETYMEPFVVEEGNTKVFTTDGSVLQARVTPRYIPPRTWLGRLFGGVIADVVELRPAVVEEAAPSELAEAIRGFLRRVDVTTWGLDDVALNTASLQELVHIAVYVHTNSAQRTERRRR